jgi:hypothetical protein
MSIERMRKRLAADRASFIEPCLPSPRAKGGGAVVRLEQRGAVAFTAMGVAVVVILANHAVGVGLKLASPTVFASPAIRFAGSVAFNVRAASLAGRHKAK